MDNPAPNSAPATAVAELGLSKSVIKYGIKAMKARHYEIARRLILGQSQGEISRELGVTESWLSMICNSPLFKVVLGRLNEARDRDTLDVAKQLSEAAINAVEIEERIMYTSTSEKVKMAAAQDIMDRAGFGRVTKSLNVTAHVDTSSMSKDEKMRVIMERVGRMRSDAHQKEEELKSAEAIEIDWQEVPEEAGSGGDKETRSTIEQQAGYGSID